MDQKENTSTDFMRRIRERFHATMGAWNKQYKLSIEDINFLTPNNQWPEDAKQARSGKPTIASDRLNAQVKQICNQQRDNRPAICYHAVNSEADEETANVLQGMARHIEYRSRADLAYDLAHESAVQGGIGFIRILTEYRPGTFDQEIKIEPVSNWALCYIDPTFRSPDGSDIGYAFLIEPMTPDEFKEKYPDADISGRSDRQWAALETRFPDWFDENNDNVLVVEYYEKTEKWYKLVKLSDGKVMDKADCSDDQKEMIVEERDDCKPVVKWYKLCCDEVLEETEWIGKDIPVIPVFGDVILDNGNRIFSGLVRNTKEQQVMLNTIQTVILEQIAKAPKNPWIVAEGSVDDHKDEWAAVNTLDLPYLVYKVHEEGSDIPLPMPQRNVQEAPIQNMLAMLQVLENDIKATSAIFDPTLGEKMANDQSGVAIKALQQAGNIAHYNYSDNLSRAIRVVGKQLLDLMPKVYSEPQVIRIVGVDDKHSLVGINGAPQPEGGMTMDGVHKVYDITTGEYDVTVDTGPSYYTRRQENLNMLTQLAMKNPVISQSCMDLIVGLMDFPESAELKSRLEKLLPPQLQPKPKAGDPQALQNQLDQAHIMIQQLTQVLQKETELANQEQTRLQVAQIQSQTELTKHQTQIQHDANKTLLQAQMSELKQRFEQQHDIMKAIHDHLFKKDQATHDAILAVKTAPQPAQTEQA